MDDLTDTPVEETEPFKLLSKSSFASKIVANIAAGAVSTVVVRVINQNTTTPVATAEKLRMYVGVWVLSAMAADKAAGYVEERVAPYFERVENFLWIPVEPDPWTPILVTIEPTTENPTEQ